MEPGDLNNGSKLFVNGDSDVRCINEQLSSKTSVTKVESGLHVTCFTEELNDGLLHFQIINFQKQIYVWIGYNTAKFGHLYAAAPTRPNNSVSVTSLLGGGADNSGLGIARRLALKTGLNIVVACNLPKDDHVLEAGVERKLVEKLKVLGLIKLKTPSPSIVSV